MKLCKQCGRPMSPPEKYRSHQSMCWDCFGKQNNQYQTLEGGHVYIAEYFNMYTQRTYKGMYKVGMTERDNAQKRVAEIGDTLGPMKVRVVRHWSCKNPRKTEKRIHSKLKRKNITGEWFDINKRELIKIVNETIHNT